MKDTDTKGKDKILHLVACIILSIYETEVAEAALITKEYADSRASGNHWCWWDLLYDHIGVIIGTTMRLVLIMSIYGHFRWRWY